MSLRARILWLVLAVTALPVLAMVWLLVQQRETTILQARAQLAAQADGLASDLDDKLAGTAQLLFGLGRVPLLAGTDKPACSNFLADVLKEHPQYTGLLTILPDGTLHCDSLRSGRVLNLSDRRYFQQASQQQRYVVEPMFGRLTGKGVVQIAYPVRRADDALQHVLLASFNLDAYGQALAAALVYPNMRLQVVDNDGRVIMQQAKAGRSEVGQLLADPLARQAVQAGGDRRGPAQTQTLGRGANAEVWAVATLPRRRDTGLRLLLRVPEADLSAQVERQFQQALGGLATLSLLIFVSAALLAEFAVRRQAARLVLAISRMDAGNFSEPIGQPYPSGELGKVMAALDRMAGSLLQQRGEIHRNTEALERQANIDPLTGLANRNLLNDRLEQALIVAQRGHRGTAVLVLDLDRFKTVNDSLGHGQGDVLLQQVAQRLQACVRPGDTVARLGGDEFVVLLTDMADAADCLPLARKMLAALAQPVRLAEQDINASASLGIALYPRDGTTADLLLRHADTAMYRAKDQGGHTLAFFTPEMNQYLLERLHIEAGLRRALAHNGLRLHYQPIVNLRSGQITSAEALLRWHDAELGEVSPARFIPVAEESGLIVAIGEWVLREACLQAQAWQRPGQPVVPVAVNLSARQFGAASLLTSIERALHDSGCPAAALQLEITESMVMHDTEGAMATMHKLKALGLRLSIDDFGTGHSSLSYLKRFPVHKLKIDRSFVRDITTDADDAAIVDTILTLARKLGLRCVAEGVETPAQLARLQALGCDEYQGYLFARPGPAPDLVQRLDTQQRQRVPADEALLSD